MTNTTKRMMFLRKFMQLTNFACLQGIGFIVTSFYRSPEEQNKLFKEGKSKCDGYKKKSNHQRWLAMDIVVIRKNKAIWERTQEYEELGEFWANLLGGTWGGNWKNFEDVFHFEWTNGD